MVKLKNLWKIVLVIMAVSAMLIACTTDSNDTGEKEENRSDCKIYILPLPCQVG